MSSTSIYFGCSLAPPINVLHLEDGVEKEPLCNWELQKVDCTIENRCTIHIGLISAKMSLLSLMHCVDTQPLNFPHFFTT